MNKQKSRFVIIALLLNMLQTDFSLAAFPPEMTAKINQTLAESMNLTAQVSPAITDLHQKKRELFAWIVWMLNTQVLISPAPYFPPSFSDVGLFRSVFKYANIFLEREARYRHFQLEENLLFQKYSQAFLDAIKPAPRTGIFTNTLLELGNHLVLYLTFALTTAPTPSEYSVPSNVHQFVGYPAPPQPLVQAYPPFSINPFPPIQPYTSYYGGQPYFDQSLLNQQIMPYFPATYPVQPNLSMTYPLQGNGFFQDRSPESVSTSPEDWRANYNQSLLKQLIRLLQNPYSPDERQELKRLLERRYELDTFDPHLVSYCYLVLGEEQTFPEISVSSEVQSSNSANLINDEKSSDPERIAEPTSDSPGNPPPDLQLSSIASSPLEDAIKSGSSLNEKEAETPPPIQPVPLASAASSPMLSVDVPKVSVAPTVKTSQKATSLAEYRRRDIYPKTRIQEEQKEVRKKPPANSGRQLFKPHSLQRNPKQYPIVTSILKRPAPEIDQLPLPSSPSTMSTPQKPLPKIGHWLLPGEFEPHVLDKILKSLPQIGKLASYVDRSEKVSEFKEEIKEFPLSDSQKIALNRLLQMKLIESADESFKERQMAIARDLIQDSATSVTPHLRLFLAIRANLLLATWYKRKEKLNNVRTLIERLDQLPSGQSTEAEQWIKQLKTDYDSINKLYLQTIEQNLTLSKKKIKKTAELTQTQIEASEISKKQKSLGKQPPLPSISSLPKNGARIEENIEEINSKLSKIQQNWDKIASSKTLEEVLPLLDISPADIQKWSKQAEEGFSKEYFKELRTHLIRSFNLSDKRMTSSLTSKELKNIELPIEAYEKLILKHYPEGHKDLEQIGKSTIETFKEKQFDVVDLYFPLESTIKEFIQLKASREFIQDSLVFLMNLLKVSNDSEFIEFAGKIVTLK